jgi:hypothetical protein
VFTTSSLESFLAGRSAAGERDEAGEKEETS